MEDPFGVRGAKRVGNLGGQVQQLVLLERAAAKPMLQRFALQEFHHDEGLAVVLVDVEDRADVGMAQRGSRPRLTPQSLQCVRILLCKILGQELERHQALEAGVFGLVNHTHAAATEQFENAVVGDDLADHGKAAPIIAGA